MEYGRNNSINFIVYCSYRNLLVMLSDTLGTVNEPVGVTTLPDELEIIVN